MHIGQRRKCVRHSAPLRFSDPGSYILPNRLLLRPPEQRAAQLDVKSPCQSRTMKTECWCMKQTRIPSWYLFRSLSLSLLQDRDFFHSIREE